MGRKILFITTDQQRYDTLGCNGGLLSRTPVVDRLAAEGVRYERAIPQSVVCMPSRSTMLTGQHPSTHGVWMNGVALPVDAPSVAAELHRAGYRTALVGKPHFEPFLDPFGRFTENRLARDEVPTVDSPWADGTVGPHRGFDHLEFATHSPVGPLHYSRWLMAEHPEHLGGFYQVLDADLEVNAAGGGDTGAPQVQDNPVPRDCYHTDWVADRAIAWLDGLAGGRRLVLLGQLPGPAPPVGSARLRAGSRAVARRPAAGRLPRVGRRARGAARRQAASLAALVRRPARVELRGSGLVGAGHPHRGPAPGGVRPQRRGGRAHRRGRRPDPRGGLRARVGRRPRRRVHHGPR